MWLSGLCLVHCLAFPLAVLLAPTLANWLGATETMTHWILFGIALPISAVALTRGYQRLHSGLTLVLGYTGLALMLFAVSQRIFGSELEVLLTVIGVSAVDMPTGATWQGIKARPHNPPFTLKVLL